ncbi:hypothetical protein J6590_003414 [Homalodisca vitripennis]|nr:hypothetical protein J6590_003414 [Homalodisca vitripennis]
MFPTRRSYSYYWCSLQGDHTAPIDVPYKEIIQLLLMFPTRRSYSYYWCSLQGDHTATTDFPYKEIIQLLMLCPLPESTLDSLLSRLEPCPETPQDVCTQTSPAVSRCSSLTWLSDCSSSLPRHSPESEMDDRSTSSADSSTARDEPESGIGTASPPNPRHAKRDCFDRGVDIQHPNPFRER